MAWRGIALSRPGCGSILFLSHAALTDIYHGEKDANLEWTLLRLALLVILLLIVATIVCTRLVLKYFRDKEAEKERKIPD